MTQDIMTKKMTDEEAVNKMLELKDNGYTWREIYEEMCKIGQFNGFKNNCELVSFILEELPDELYKMKRLLERIDIDISKDF